MLAILVIVTGGIMYLTSGGNQENVERAKRWLSYGIIGFVIALLAYVIVYSITAALRAGGVT